MGILSKSSVESASATAGREDEVCRRVQGHCHRLCRARAGQGMDWANMVLSILSEC